MGKIIRFKSKSDDVEKFLEDALEKAKEYKVDNVMIAFKLRKEDAYIMTGYCNLDMAEKQELISHVQIDIVNDMIKQNYITS